MEQLTATTRKPPRVPSRASAGAGSFVLTNSLIQQKSLIVFKRLAMLVISAALLLTLTTGCDSADAPEEMRSATQKKTRALPQRDDPAMAGAQRRDAEVPMNDSDATAEQVPGEQAPTGLTIDNEAGLVFVPDIGWMDVPSFAALYLKTPEKLPGSFDHQAVHALLQEHDK